MTGIVKSARRVKVGKREVVRVIVDYADGDLCLPFSVIWDSVPVDIVVAPMPPPGAICAKSDPAPTISEEKTSISEGKVVGGDGLEPPTLSV